MKIGDIVYSTKIRPYEHAVIIKADVDIRWREGKDGVRKKETRTSYVAQFTDKTTMTFYGFNVNKSVFKYILPDGQISLSDIFNLEV